MRDRGAGLTTRREVLALGLAFAASGVRAAHAGSARHEEWLRLAAERPGLAAAAARSNVLFGTAVQAHEIASDPAYAALLSREVQLITAENELKWGVVRPTRSTFNFGPADQVFGFCQARGMAMRGTPLVWHVSLPAWFDQTADRGNVREIGTEHIRALCGHYAGKLHSWDVVNEPIHVQDGERGGLRRSAFFRLMGADYIEWAFDTAFAADPTTTLVLNEINLETDDALCASRRHALLALLKRLTRNGVPIHALGIESHLTAAGPRFDAGVFRRFLRDVAALGLAIFITEMDVTDKLLGPDQARRDAAVASTYGAFLRAALAEPAVTSIQTWGLTDRYSWLTSSPWTRRDDGLNVRGCLYDQDLAPKAARGAVEAALTRA